MKYSVLRICGKLFPLFVFFSELDVHADAATNVVAEGGRVADLYLTREKGMRAMGDHIYSAAARFFVEYRSSTQNQEPQLADATILLVKAYLLQGEAAKADAALSYHKQHSKNLADPYYLDGLSYWRAAILLAQGKLAVAASQVEPLTRQSNVPEYRNLSLELLGDAYARQKKWKLAESALQRLLKEFPDAENTLRARLGLVKVYLATNQSGMASQVMASIQRYHENAPELILNLYRVLLGLQEGRLDEAFALYQKIDMERPQKPDSEWWVVVSQLATALVDAKRYADAVVILPQTTALAGSENERVQSLLRTAEVLIALEKVELAIDSLESFRKKYPARIEVVPVQVKLAELLRRTKNFMTASEYFGEVADNERAAPEFRYRAAISRGWCFREGGQFANAVQAFASAAKLGQSDAQKGEGLFLAGDTAFLIEDYTNAALYYQKVADKYGKTTFAEKARLHQARAREKAKLFNQAAQIYKQFLTEFPSSPFVQEASLERGIALKHDRDYAQAVIELCEFAVKYAGEANAPRALMEAGEAAMGADNIPEAIRVLSEVVARYAESDFYPHAIYQRAHVLFYDGKDEAAIRDCELFLEKFPLLPMANDILIWLGDYYVNAGKLARGEQYFLKLVTTSPRSPQAPSALYEAAKSAFQRDDLSRARLLLQQFAEDYTGKENREGYPVANPRVRAQGQVLNGDILANQGKYEEAVSHFSQARELAGDTPLGLAALGRRGEMYYSLGAASKDNLNEAVKCFQAILENEAAPVGLQELARYRLAKCQEKLGNQDAAIESYLHVVYQYDIDLKKKMMRDWFYFGRSVYDAARLLLMTERYREAARLYERFAETGLPTASDALQKAQEIRATHGFKE